MYVYFCLGGCGIERCCKEVLTKTDLRALLITGNHTPVGNNLIGETLEELLHVSKGPVSPLC